MAQPEAKLTGKIIDAMRKRGAFVAKVHGGMYQTSGLPDIVACHRGWFVGLEVKRPGRESTVTTLQAKTLDAIDKAQGISAVVSSVEQASHILAKIDKMEEE